MNTKIKNALFLSVGTLLTAYSVGKTTYLKREEIDRALKERGSKKIFKLVKTYFPSIITFVATMAADYLIIKNYEMTYLGALYLAGIKQEKKEENKSEKNPGGENSEKVLFYDEYSGRYFEATERSMNDAIQSLRKRFYDNGAYSINDFYELMGLKNVIKQADRVWINPNYQKDEFPPPKYTFCKMDDGLECYIVSFPQVSDII